MNKLVETFISEHLRRLCRGRLEVRKQFSLFLDDERRVNIRPDLVFYIEKQGVFVADIKYKAAATIDDASTADLYQLLAYITRLGLRSGAVITCIADPRLTNRRRDHGSTIGCPPRNMATRPHRRVRKNPDFAELMADRIVRMSQLAVF